MLELVDLHKERWWARRLVVFVAAPGCTVCHAGLDRLGGAAAWQAALAIALMVVPIGLAGRIDAGAVLHTGERVKIPVAWRLAEDVTA